MRLFVLALLLANGLYFAWSQGLLLDYGLGPAPQGEPQRLSQQIAPDSVRLLTTAQYQRVQEQLKAEQMHRECLQAGPLDAAQADGLRTLLGASLPPDAWRLDDITLAPRWIVYMGKFANASLLAKKRAEMVALKLPLEGLQNPELEPGLSLGAHESRAAAEAALAALKARGVQTARVLQERDASSAYLLRLPAVTAALSPKLADLRTALGDTPLRSCEEVAAPNGAAN